MKTKTIEFTENEKYFFISKGFNISVDFRGISSAQKDITETKEFVFWKRKENDIKFEYYKQDIGDGYADKNLEAKEHKKENETLENFFNDCIETYS